jgi:hypothetical protein
VTLFAPAKNIPVANHDAYGTYRDSRGNGGASGTSWSAPIVAGMAARILQSNTGYTITQVYDALMARTAPDLDLTELDPPGITTGDTPNKVLRLTPVVVQALPAITPAASSGNTTLTITASGATGLQYELFQVNSAFNVALYNKGDAAATKIAGPQSSNTFSVPSTGAISYFARVRSSCGSADSNITTVTSLTAPAGLVATASGGTVTIQWNQAANATGYQVERKIGTAGWTLAQTVTSGSQTSVTDTPTVPAGVVLYRVRATQGSATSDPSNNDVAYTATFTDDPILTSAPYTVVKAVHVIEIRQAVNALRELANEAAIYSSNDLDVNLLRGQVIQAQHFTSLMTELNAARGPFNLGTAGFQYTFTAGSVIHNTHMRDLRLAVK